MVYEYSHRMSRQGVACEHQECTHASIDSASFVGFHLRPGPTNAVCCAACSRVLPLCIVSRLHRLVDLIICCFTVSYVCRPSRVVRSCSGGRAPRPFTSVGAEGAETLENV